MSCQVLFSPDELQQVAPSVMRNVGCPAAGWSPLDIESGWVTEDDYGEEASQSSKTSDHFTSSVTILTTDSGGLVDKCQYCDTIVKC